MSELGKAIMLQHRTSAIWDSRTYYAHEAYFEEHGSNLGEQGKRGTKQTRYMSMLEGCRGRSKGMMPVLHECTGHLMNHRKA